ncbi:hypothetical protein NHQ30_001291 [Ciborinia camelliae]|nr:hypothetical protein NHQ30_001291 [Ciborinia camelliae]
MSLCRGVPLNLIVLMTFILFILVYHRAGKILPEINDSRELAAYLRDKFPTKNEPAQHAQEFSGLLCPEKGFTCPTPKPIELECPAPAAEDAPIITGLKSLEQEMMNGLREQGVMVVFKTGAQEISQLAIHLGTTLRYFQERDILFFSDSEGTIGPFLIHDALKTVDQKIRETHVDFKIYRDIKRCQISGRDIEELKEDKNKGEGRWGWRLDKYKFIHMAEEVYFKEPNAKWYIFIETDSYVIWSNLITWLKKLDSTKPLYLGAGLIHEETYFAHGGSGYILSNAAMNVLFGPKQPKGLAASWDTKMDGECCGDVALAKALYEQGVKLTGSHPFLNGDKPSTFAYGPKEHWCQPAITMHHLKPHEISSVWRFERQREIMQKSWATMFSELYSHFVEPHIVPSRDNWNNLSNGPTYTEPDETRKTRKKEREKMVARMKEDAEKQKVEDKKSKERITNVTTVLDEIEKDDEKETLAGVDKALGRAQRMNANRKKGKGEKAITEKESMGNHLPSSNYAKKDIQPEFNTSQTNADKLQEVDAGDSDSDTEIGPRAAATSTKVSFSENTDKYKRSQLSDIEKEAYKSFEACGRACENQTECFQWVYYDRTCRLSTSIRLGNYQAPTNGKDKGDDGKPEQVGWKSGWLVDRINEWVENNECKEPDWKD